MIKLNCDPLLTIAQCEICPNLVTKYATGLCERCMAIWIRKTSVMPLRITPDLVKAAVVMAAHETYHTSMDETFREAIEQEQRHRKGKLELFQKICDGFQQCMLLEEFHDDKVFEVEEDFCETPLADDEVYQRSRKQFTMVDVIDLPPQILEETITMANENDNTNIN